MTEPHEVIIVWPTIVVTKGGTMKDRTVPRLWPVVALAAAGSLSMSTGLCFAADGATKSASGDRREEISLADAALRALKNNLDISISRHTKESRLTDIIVEQAKFDPTLSVNGQYNRTVNPLNRPVFGGTGGNLNQITIFDQRVGQVTVDATTNLITGGNLDLNYSPTRTNVNQDVANGFLFNPAWTGGLAATLTQPLLRNAGIDVNKTFIRIAQNNATVEEHVFRDRVLTVLATVEQTYWEVVFANENLKVAEAALKAAQNLLAENRAKAKAGVMSIVDVLQAEAAVASRVEQIIVAEKAIRDQEDLLRRLLNPGEDELRLDVRLTPKDAPVVALEPISLQEAIDIAIEQRPEIVQAKKNVETSDLNTKFAKNQLLPTLSFQGTLGLSGLGANYADMSNRNFSGDFYNYGAGLVLSYPLGNRSAWSTFNRRQIEGKNAETSLASVRQQIIIGVKEAVRRVQTDFKRIETTRSARIMAEKQLQAEQERLKVGLSTTRFVLDFQRDLATAQGNELRAIVDYNKSLSNLSRHKASTLDRYSLQVS
ncbi:MAG TPA: TolC family protein [Nitrospira sp.]|nr:TolC family protein [Nitrospira sp.]